MINLNQLGHQARSAFQIISRSNSDIRNRAVLAIADELESCFDDIRAANQQDIQMGKASGLSEALIDRLTLTDQR